MPPPRDLTVAATVNTHDRSRSFARTQPLDAHKYRLSWCLSGWYESQIHHRWRLPHRRGIARLHRDPERKTEELFRTSPRRLLAHRGPAEHQQNHSEHKKPLAARSKTPGGVVAAVCDRRN